MMRLHPLPPEGELLLVRRLICGSFDQSPAYLSFSSKGGLRVQPFERELASATYVNDAIAVLKRDSLIPDTLCGRALLDYINEKGLWYDNASRSHGAGEASEERAEPMLYIMPRISSRDFMP